MSEYNEVSSRSSSNGGRYAGHYERRSPKKRKRRNNKTMILLIATVLVVVAVIILIIAFGGNKNNDILVGTWKYDQYTEYEFNDNGVGYLCVDDVRYEYKYKISGDKLKLDFTEDIVRDCEYTFTVEEKNLTLVGGEGTDKGTYKLSKISQLKSLNERNDLQNEKTSTVQKNYEYHALYSIDIHIKS